MRVLGHRGCILKGQPYQNSIGAFKLALEHVDGFETDACLTKDGDVVFIHEEVTGSEEKPTSSLALYVDEASATQIKNRTLKDISSAEVKTLKLKDGQSIPFFEDILPLFTNNDKIWNIELKAHNVTPVVIQKLKDAFSKNLLKPKQIILSSFDHKALLDVRKKLPQIQIGALFVAESNNSERLNPWRDDAEGYYMPLTEENLTRPLIYDINPHFIIAPHTELNQKQVKLIKQHFKKSKFSVWVCGEYNNFESAEFEEKIQTFSKNSNLNTIIVDDILKHKT